MWESIFGTVLVGLIKAIFARFQKDPASETIKEIRDEAKSYESPVPDKSDVIKRL